MGFTTAMFHLLSVSFILSGVKSQTSCFQFALKQEGHWSSTGLDELGASERYGCIVLCREWGHTQEREKNKKNKKDSGWMWTIYWSIDGLGNYEE
jgi:hypothetical protein